MSDLDLEGENLSAERDLDLAEVPVPSDAMKDTLDRETRTEYAAILAQFRKRIEESYAYWETTYTNSRKDVDFVYVEQWPEEAKTARQNRPQLTLNVLPQYAQQVVNSARRAKFSIQVDQIAGENKPFLSRTGGSVAYDRSQVMEGLIRDIEDRSKAHNCYSRALQHAVEGGFGWLFVTTAECLDDPFNIELEIEHVRDRYSVLVDPQSERENLSDAKWICKSRDYDWDEFREEWPNAVYSDTGMPMAGHRRDEGSYSEVQQNTVRVTDYWWKEPVEREACEYIRAVGTVEDRLVLYRDEHEGIFDELEEQGYQKGRTVKVQGYRIRYARVTNHAILDGPHWWPSTILPGVMVRGREINLQTDDVLNGMFRYSKDAARMLNYWMSQATEKMALLPRAPYLISEEQISGHKDQWMNMYQQNSPVLVYTSDPDVPPPARVNTTDMATGELQLMSNARSLLQDTIGMHDAGLGRRSNEVSGIALNERQEQIELGNYDFLDNLSKSVVRIGEILCDMIPRVYTGSMARRLIMNDDSQIFVDLNKDIVDEETGKTVRVFSMDFSRYACRVDVGPASKTQRQEFVNMMIEWGRSDPDGFALFRDLIVKHMDIPQAHVIADRMKKTVPREFLSETEQAEVPPPQPSPEQQAEIMKAQAEMMKAQAEIAKAELMVKSSEFRAAQDEARLQLEVERGVNRQGEEASKSAENARKDREKEQRDSEGDERKIAALIKREVAKALASSKKES